MTRTIEIAYTAQRNVYPSTEMGDLFMLPCLAGNLAHTSACTFAGKDVGPHTVYCLLSESLVTSRRLPFNHTTGILVSFYLVPFDDVRAGCTHPPQKLTKENRSSIYCYAVQGDRNRISYTSAPGDGTY